MGFSNAARSFQQDSAAFKKLKEGFFTGAADDELVAFCLVIASKPVPSIDFSNAAGTIQA